MFTRAQSCLRAGLRSVTIRQRASSSPSSGRQAGRHPKRHARGRAGRNLLDRQLHGRSQPSCPPRLATVAAVEMEVQRLKALATRASAAASDRIGLKAPRSVVVSDRPVRPDQRRPPGCGLEGNGTSNVARTARARFKDSRDEHGQDQQSLVGLRFRKRMTAKIYSRAILWIASARVRVLIRF